MPDLQAIALLVLAAAAVTMLLITQTKHRVAWAGWLVPALAVVPLAGATIHALVTDGAAAFWPVPTGSPWGLQLWSDRLMGVTAAFYLLQNRARAAGMKSEVWVLLVIFTGSLGLLPMLARTLYCERRQSLAHESGAAARMGTGQGTAR